MTTLDQSFKLSTPDARDKPASFTMPATLPASVDLKPWVEEVEDQGPLNSCTANAGCEALELAYERAGKSEDFSRLFLYWYTRLLGGIRGDNGAMPRDIGKALNQYGVCLEPTWDYILTQVNVEPSAVAQVEAKNYPTYAYENISGSTANAIITKIKGALALGIPVLTSMAVHRAFFGLKGDWHQHSWDINTSTNNPLDGYHEVLIIGYDDASQRFLTQNSWGPAWADGGFFGIPYSFIGNEVSEWWILSKIGVDYIPVDQPQPQPAPPLPPAPVVKPATDNAKWLMYAIGLAVAVAAVYNLFIK